MERHIEILTPRLILRRPQLEDAAAINAAMNENWYELQKWMSWSFDGANTMEATQHYISVIVPEQDKQGFLSLFGFCRETGQFIVASGIVVKDGRQETGYWVAPAFFGKGYAAESANAIIRYAFGQRNVREFFINHYEGNIKSEKIIRALGFQELAVQRQAQARCLDGKMLDVHDYIMTDPSVLPPLQVEWRQRCP